MKKGKKSYKKLLSISDIFNTSELRSVPVWQTDKGEADNVEGHLFNFVA